MSGDDNGLSKNFGQINISGEAVAHLGDNYRYGDTFHVGSISQATFLTFTAPQDATQNERAAGAIGFVRSAEATLQLGRVFSQLISGSQDPDLRKQTEVFQAIWNKTETELRNILLDIAPRDHAPNIDRFLAFQESHLDDLHTKLYSATYKINKSGNALMMSVNSPTSAVPGSVGISWQSRVLGSLIHDVEKWFTSFEAACRLLARLSCARHNLEGRQDPENEGEDIPSTVVGQIRHLISQSRTNRKRKSPPLLDEADFIVLREIGSRNSAAWLATHTKTGDNVVLNDTAYPIDSSKKVPDATIRAIGGTVRDLACLLSISDPFAHSLPRCIGIIRRNPTSFRYVLSLPTATATPISLRSALNAVEPSLSVKLSYARMLGKAIMFLHAAETVHKSLRPDNIILAESSDSSKELSMPFLIGFEQFRRQNDHSALVADAEWYNNIYRHPTRQGLRVQDFYVMQHDIYSFGVCLLEVGLWESFVLYDTDYPSQEPVANAVLKIDEFRSKNKSLSAHKFKDWLVELAKAQLAAKTGDIFTEVVLSCLNCLDKESSNIFDDEADLYDDDGLLIGVAFIDKVLLKLENIVV